MATTTPNFGWDIPQSTDLVKDGATAIAALGTDIDSALVDLKGGTTGQVLSKNSNTDLDFTWVAQDDSNAIQNTIVDAKGDLISATAADTPARLAVGTDGQYLQADSSTATGLKWATVSAGGMTQLATGSLGGSSVSLTSISGSYEELTLYIRNVGFSTANELNITINSNTGSVYNYMIISYNTGYVEQGGKDQTNCKITNWYPSAGFNEIPVIIKFPDYTSASTKVWNFQSFVKNGSSEYPVFGWGAAQDTNAITSIQITTPNTFNNGTYELWGVK